MSVEIRVGDCLEVLKTLDAESVQCVVTSPPYFGLRDYGVVGQIGLEPSPDAYVAKLVAVFAEVRRVLRDDGTLWVNLGDSYTTGASTAARKSDPKAVGDVSGGVRRIGTPDGMKAKDLIGIPWMVAFALRADGWYLRSDIVWHKPNAMPESVKDRPTKAHEYLFLLAKSERYYYDVSAIAEPLASDPATWGRHSHKDPGANAVIPRPMFGPQRGGRDGTEFGNGKTRNRRSVWTVATTPYSGAHFATFPPALIEPCILAGSRPGDTVLDVFAGAGTTGVVAANHSRNALLIELNPAYAALARERIKNDNPLFADVS